MAYGETRLGAGDGAAPVTLNRPERLNAYTPIMGRELAEAFAACDADDAVRAIIVTGAGRTFCAGATWRAAGRPSIGPRPPSTRACRPTARGRSPRARSRPGPCARRSSPR